MALAARGVVSGGTPVLPSDLVYWRAPLLTYLLAGSTILFGDTEWALRFPSAICGSVCGLLAFFLGRRFLNPAMNMAFVGSVTFLPAMIEISQTARMYVFLVASLMLFAIFLFQWERDRSSVSLLWTFVALVVAIQFHLLAVFAAPMLLFPGFSNRSWRQMLLGLALLLLAVGFSEWVGAFSNQDYPDDTERLIVAEEEPISALAILWESNSAMFLSILGVTVIAAIGALVIGRRINRSELPALMLLSGGIGACAVLQYHLGCLAITFGTILWFRDNCGGRSRIWLLFAIVALLAFIHLFFLSQSGKFSGRKLFGALVGIPSIWPTLRMLEFSAVGGVLIGTGLATALIHLSRGGRVPLHWLFFGIAVWAPLAAIGVFRWYAAARYMTGILPFFLLAVFTATGWIVAVYPKLGSALANRQALKPVMLGILTIAVVNPVAAWTTALNSYASQPDHKGAADFVRSLSLTPSDIIIAEDSIVQTYYLGHVDYRLQSAARAKSHAKYKDGILYDQYTGTPVIVSGQKLRDLLNSSPGARIIIISSTQVSPSLMSRNRGAGISQVLESGLLKVAHVGRDGATTVWEAR